MRTLSLESYLHALDMLGTAWEEGDAIWHALVLKHLAGSYMVGVVI